MRTYIAGATVYELADRFKINRKTVSEHLHRTGTPMRRQRLDEEAVGRATALYERGWSLSRVGEELSVDAHTVRTALLRRGITMRDTHGRG